MINLTGANIWVLFVIGLAFMGVYCWMLTDRVSTRIRNSKAWFLGWLGGLFILSTGAKLMMPVLDMLLSKTGMHDEDIIPYLFGLMMIVVLASIAIQLYKFRRIRKANEERYEAYLRRS
ncbi:hypothetical protein [Burkholderia phage FLC9]|nr:hypothetical protein [Burkholderia phage FLC9]